MNTPTQKIDIHTSFVSYGKVMHKDWISCAYWASALGYCHYDDIMSGRIWGGRGALVDSRGSIGMFRAGIGNGIG